VRLWWIPELRDGRCWFRTDSDAVSLKALTGFLSQHYSGRTPHEVIQGERAPLERLGLLRHLADNRRATVLRVEDLIHAFASEALDAPPPPAASA
jgi:cysteine desulfuration protein SufE